MGVGWGEGWVSVNLRDGKSGVLGSRYQWGFPPLLKIPFFRGLGVGVGVWGVMALPPPPEFPAHDNTPDYSESGDEIFPINQRSHGTRTSNAEPGNVFRFKKYPHHSSPPG